MRSAHGEGLRFRASDEVVVSDTSERQGDVDGSSNEGSELRGIMGLGWYKWEKATLDEGGRSG